MDGWRLLCFCAVVLASCSKSTPEETPPTKGPLASRPSGSGPAPEDCKRVFVAPNGAEPLCDEHVMGNGMEIHWRSYGSKEPRSALEAPYRSGAAQCGYALLLEPPAFEVSDRGAMRLGMFEATAKGYPTCSVAPKAEHKTVIVVSEKHDR